MSDAFDEEVLPFEWLRNCLKSISLACPKWKGPISCDRHLIFLKENGVMVVSLTFDGTSCNFAMAAALGVNLKVEELSTHFLYGDRRIYVLLDPSHMLKLSLHAANKLRSRHIQWHREKMKLASQTLSRSVASALEYFGCSLKVENFTGCEATVKFIHLFNGAFDILNCRNLLSKEFNSPIKESNSGKIFARLGSLKSYVANLKSKDGLRILQSKRKTGFLGMVVAGESVCALFKDLRGSEELEFLLTYKLSQDHLETFFSTIRSKGGFNNNPTTIQFVAAYRRLLLLKYMSILQGGNCVPQDGTTLLSVAGNSTVNPHIPKTRLPEPLRDEVDQGPPENHTYSLISKSTTVSAYVDDVVGYIAGYVQRKLLKEVKCEECAQAIRESHGEGAANILIKMRTNGGLHVPSKDLTTVCQLVENVFRRYQAKGQLTARAAMDRMQSHCLREISERKSGVFCSLNDHALDQTPFDSHRIVFISVKTSLQITESLVITSIGLLIMILLYNGVFILKYEGE
ncbi:hypothetical protein J437_LFUL005106 [Ladona fulva]|uniref:DNA transposase THAP9 n=1 Tax=Ladona fulva TaxID=123851 RepID=A0A8K0JY72_LADFU|nr:hypothetical protein J437_LFUL005106 [Ladona fulva]